MSEALAIDILPVPNSNHKAVYLDGRHLFTASERILPLLAMHLIERGYEPDEYEINGKSLRQLAGANGKANFTSNGLVTNYQPTI